MNIYNFLTLLSPEIVNKISIQHNQNITIALQKFSETGIPIVVVVDSEKKFIGVLSSGDVRRLLGENISRKAPLNKVVNRHAITAEFNLSKPNLYKKMQENHLDYLPILKSDKTVYGVYFFDKKKLLGIDQSNHIIIMAGGKGTRLLPLTKNTPKPMLKIHGKPILQLIIEKSVQEDFCDITISVNYLRDKIISYFGNGSKFGAEIKYLEEKTPMGTAGSLSLLQSIEEKNFIVTNADIITDIKFRDILEFHQLHGAHATMIVREHEIQNPFGVVNAYGFELNGFDEKPIYKSLINTGIYIFSSEVLNYLPKNCFLDMPDLFTLLKNAGLKTLVMPRSEFWTDIGKTDELEKLREKYDQT